MVAASVLLTTIMLFWGISLQGQSNSNYGSAVFRSNSQASEQISIDSVLFTKVSSSPSVYTVTVYARNFGSNPIKLAGIHFGILASGISPSSVNCEVTTSQASTAHLVIVARASGAVTLNASPPSLTTPGCTSSQNLPSSWDSQTISIEIATDQGTLWHQNFSVPA